MPVSDAIEEGRLRRAGNSGDVTAMRITFETTEAARRADYADAVRQIEENAALKARDADSTDAVVTAREAGPRR
jgi:hypothetical protein